MKSEQISNPLIVYWDIPSSADEDNLINRICDELVKTGIFILHLRDLSTPLSTATRSILKKLHGESIRVEMTVAEGAIEDIRAEQQLAGINKLYIEVVSARHMDRLAGRMKHLKQEEMVVGISIPCEEDTWRSIPEIVSSCIQYDIRNFEVPIQRPRNGSIFCIEPEILQWLSGELGHSNLQRMDLSVHDPFLWNVFHKDNNPNTEGCNGAKTMICISEDFEVTPCPIMPLSLGNLKDQSLEDIFLSEERACVVRDLSLLPAECDGCEDLGTCRGGCRGRAYVLSQSLEKRDPVCFIET